MSDARRNFSSRKIRSSHARREDIKVVENNAEDNVVPLANKQKLEAYKEHQRKTQEKLKSNTIFALLFGAVELGDIGAIFGHFFKESAHTFLESTGKFFMFPLAALMSIGQTILTWRHAYLDRTKKGKVRSRNIIKGVVDTIGTTLIVGAVIFAITLAALAVTTAAAIAAPIIFTIVLGLKTLFNTGAAIYYWGRAKTLEQMVKKETDPYLKELYTLKAQNYRAMAKQNGVAAAVGALATIGVAVVMVFGKIALAGIGVAAGIIGVGYMLKQLFSNVPYKLVKVDNQGNPIANNDKDHLDNDLSLRRKNRPTVPNVKKQLAKEKAKKSDDETQSLIHEEPANFNSSVKEQQTENPVSEEKDSSSDLEKKPSQKEKKGSGIESGSGSESREKSSGDERTISTSSLSLNAPKLQSTTSSTTPTALQVQVKKK